MRTAQGCPAPCGERQSLVQPHSGGKVPIPAGTKVAPHSQLFPELAGGRLVRVLAMQKADIRGISNPISITRYYLPLNVSLISPSAPALSKVCTCSAFSLEQFLYSGTTDISGWINSSFGGRRGAVCIIPGCLVVSLATTH